VAVLGLKRLLPVSCIAGLLGALAFAVPALATTTAACQINGTADTTSVNPATGNGVQLFGGNGTYSFSSATGREA
jgi:hypothetical protein